MLVKQLSEGVVKMADRVDGRVSLRQKRSRFIAKSGNVDGLQFPPRYHLFLPQRLGHVDSKINSNMIRDEVVVGFKAGDQVVRDSGDHPVKSMAEVLCWDTDQLVQSIVVENGSNAFGVGVVRFVPVEIEVTNDDCFAGLCVVVVKGLGKFFEENRGFQLVFWVGGSAVDTEKVCGGG